MPRCPSRGGLLPSKIFGVSSDLLRRRDHEPVGAQFQVTFRPAQIPSERPLAHDAPIIIAVPSRFRAVGHLCLAAEGSPIDARVF